MKKIIKKITATAVMSLFAATQLQTPQVNVQAADGVATAEKTTAKQPKIYGRSGIVIDAKSGKILYAKKVDDRHYPASITKILTTLVAIENNKDLYDEVTFSSYAVNSIEPGSTHIGIKAGEKIPLIDVLNAIMLESANEACNGAAEHTAGTTKKFVELMNKKVKELGCTGSHFVTTNGLHDDDHYVTARDMAKISKAALENETFRYVACKPNYYIAPTNKDKHGKELWNHHKMVKRTMFNYDGVEGGKTGYTTKAGGTLVTFAKRGDQELIVVDLCAHGYELYEDTIKMLNYGFNNYKTIAPFKTMNTVLKDDTYGFLKTGNELSPYKIPLKHLNDVTVMLEKNQSASKLTYKCEDNKYIISYDGKQIGSVKLH